MESIDKTKSEVQESDADDLPSVDDFIKQLEEREKDLDISSDLVIEVGDSEVEHENIHDTFVSQHDLTASVADAEAETEETEPSIPDSSQPTETSNELKKAKEERDDLRESLRRQKRDFEGYRLRTERERTEMFKNMVGSLATQMLPVLDNLNRALDSSSEQIQEDKAQDINVFLEGIVLVNQQLNEVLAGMGVQPIPAVGEPFDPNIHEAVASEPNEEFAPSTVIQELLRGYRVDDKVIRASMVKVSAPAPPKDSPEPDGE